MTRNFKKRLLALVLTLALCTALMLPGFAATAPKDEEVDPQSTHAMVLQYTYTNYYNRLGQGHYREVIGVYYCEHCHQTEYRTLTYVLEHHTGNPCVCGYTGN